MKTFVVGEIVWVYYRDNLELKEAVVTGVSCRGTSVTVQVLEVGQKWAFTRGEQWRLLNEGEAVQHNYKLKNKKDFEEAVEQYRAAVAFLHALVEIKTSEPSTARLAKLQKATKHLNELCAILEGDPDE